MKNKFNELGEGLWYTFVVLIILFVFGGGYLLISRVLYPAWLDVQRNAVESSKSFTDSNNNMLETYKLEYSRLDTKISETDNSQIKKAYEAQQLAIIEKMCRQISTMKKQTVNPDTLNWLNSKGGCQ